jgi:hypothetical protein
MRTVQDIRNDIIDKVLAIQGEDILLELDHIIEAISIESEIIAITREQKEMLEMSEDDIKQGRIISQEDMVRRNLEWLNEA